MYQTYVCEKCGFESTNKQEVELCEAKHIGLKTLEEKRAYDFLKQHARYCGYVVSVSNNEITRESYDTAVEDLVNFETKHNIKAI